MQSTLAGRISADVQAALADLTGQAREGSVTEENLEAKALSRGGTDPFGQRYAYDCA